jgi:enoyl-[acyl-carrier-protein] reductase (NADH)
LDGRSRFDSHPTVGQRSSTITAKEAAVAVEEAGGEAHLVKGDISTPEGAQDVADRVADEVDRLDQVVHCAVDAYSTSVLETDLNRFTDAVTLNRLGLLYIVNSVRSLIGDGSSVFFLSSRGSDTVVPRYAAIGMAKAL